MSGLPSPSTSTPPATEYPKSSLSLAWGDPVLPCRGWDPSGIFVPSTDLEAKEFLYRLYNMHFWGLLPALIHAEPSLGESCERMLVKGIRTFVDASRGAACYAAGQQPQVLLAKDALQADIAAYSLEIGNFATELAAQPDYNAVPPLTRTQYLQFISICGTQGANAIPMLEALLVQMLLNQSRVSWTNGDIPTDIAAWVAEGADPQELAYFQSHGNSLDMAQIFAGSTDWYWNRIDLSQSPLVNP